MYLTSWLAESGMIHLGWSGIKICFHLNLAPEKFITVSLEETEWSVCVCVCVCVCMHMYVCIDMETRGQHWMSSSVTIHVIHSFIHSFIHPSIHPSIHSLIYLRCVLSLNPNLTNSGRLASQSASGILLTLHPQNWNYSTCQHTQPFTLVLGTKFSPQAWTTRI